jgi:PAS domain S-box-containing protein
MLLAGSLVLIFGISGLFLVDLYGRYETTIQDTKRSALSFADVLAEHTARTFEAIELTLRAADTIRRSTELPMAVSMDSARKSLQSLQSNSPALLAIGWTNAKGDVIAHSYPGPAARANISDLPHFAALRDSDQDELFVGPLFRSKVTNQWISAAALRIDDAKGEFAGVVTAPLDLSYFSRTFQSVQLGDNDLVALMRRDGTMLTREPYVESAVGKSFGQAPLFAERLRMSPSGTFEARSPVDDRDRIYAFRAVTGLPLIILVAQDRSDALAAWYRHIQTFGPLVGLLVLIILVGSLLLSRKTNQHLQQTALLEATLENMHEGLIVVDKTNRIAICNSRALGLLDLPTDFINSRPTSQDVIAYQTNSGEFELASPEVRLRVQPRLTGDTEYVYERQRPDGRLLEIRTVPFLDGGVVRTYKDITLQRRIESELSHSERQFRILAEHATDIIARLDFSGVVQYISPSCEHILGYTTAEMTGALVTDFIHPDDVAPTFDGFRMLVDGAPRSDRKIEYRFRHKGGAWIWLEANPTVVFDEAGKPRELVDVVRDITERKRMEAEAFAAKAQAEQAAIAKGEFLASMSHEIRTPLNSIIGFSGIILNRTDLAADVKRQVGLIQTASDSLLSIVNDVLDFSKIEEGKLQITPASFNMATFVDGCVAIVKGGADAKRLDLRVLIDPSVPADVVGDNQRLRQVLLNLLNNAVKFTYHGFVQLDVACVDAGTSQRTVKFSVSDTGIGIPANRQDRLFKRFSQVDGSISREFGGSGLGLAICKRLVGLMAGDIGFESRSGDGSTFWFSIPLVISEDESATSELGIASGTSERGRRILLVEDMEVNREIAIAILRNGGYEVDAVPDGADAIAAVKSTTYDLVLMDVQMPGMDGITATKILRALPPPICGIPIIAMTANVLPDQIDGFLEAGMNGHVGKPFKPAKLIGLIESHIGLRNGHRPNEPVLPHSGQPAIDQLQALISQEQLDALLAMLARRLEHFQSGHAKTDHRMLQEEAHRLASSAGLLGFRELSETCAELDTAITENRDIENLFEAARRQSIGALAELKTKLTRVPS